MASSIKGVETDLATIAAADLVRSRNDADFTNFLEADPATFQYNIGETEQKIKDNLFKNIRTLYGNDLQSVYKSKRGYTTFNEGSEKKFFFFYTSSQLNWKLGIVIPVYEIESEVRGTVYRLVAAVCAGLLMLSVLTMLGLQRFVIRPLRKLDEGTDLISRRGKLDYRIDIQTGDEIGHLANSFNDMMGTIQTSEVALKESENELKKHRDHLEDLVQKRTTELVEAKKTADDANQAKIEAGKLDIENIEFNLEEVLGKWMVWLNRRFQAKPHSRVEWIGLAEDFDFDGILKLSGELATQKEFSKIPNYKSQISKKLQ
ncbi:MAG: HAMP domain-containing protein [Deltaproteobacteria bacterium]|nr:HAMP domain-containing protein [Deltaproteobacteria bacterium]